MSNEKINARRARVLDNAGYWRLPIRHAPQGAMLPAFARCAALLDAFGIGIEFHTPTPDVR